MVQCFVPPKFVIFLIIAITLILLLPTCDLSFGKPLMINTDQYYIDNTQEQTGSNNAVTAVVFDFRGFDTLGEATVLFIAVLGISMFFRRRH
jgi:multisubunit Na+/H+ antiporter MnhB subunit